MHDIVFIEHFECLQNLPEESVSLDLGETSFLLNHPVQGTPIAELVDEVIVVGCLEHIDVGDYVGAFVAYLRQDVDFVDGALLQLGRIFEFLGGDYFYCELLACDDVLGPVDLGECALTHQLHQHVLFDCFAHVTMLLLYTIIIIEDDAERRAKKYNITFWIKAISKIIWL